ncbi:hypothetical protein Pan216_32100 [Planctomycetes bacterium Pan216]|uniref:DUF2964 family protein n=1 Tax=Kolteria novifilia TaxID=2527975 RepID=A0A518B5U0_9BACT|nr:hypothetical protein Pan216_32100 [Planctomycetes bacterium Pan216]
MAARVGIWGAGVLVIAALCMVGLGVVLLGRDMDDLATFAIADGIVVLACVGLGMLSSSPEE